MLNKLLLAFWANTKKQDDKRIKTLTLPEGVEESVNHKYLSDGHIYHQLDVYYPEGTTDKLPVIIDIHGGGWMYGDKELNKPYCLTLAKRGNVVFNISYRLSPEVNPISQLKDIGYALKWVSEHLDDYPCDKSSICITGDSAGGMLSLFTAMLSVSEELRDIFGVIDFSLKFDAVGLTSPMTRMNGEKPISFYTRHILGKGFEKEKWGAYVNVEDIIPFGEMPPTFFVTSSGDFLAKKDTLFAAELFKRKGIPCELMNWDEVNGKELPHVFSILYPEKEPSRKTIDSMLAFFKKYSRQQVTE